MNSGAPFLSRLPLFADVSPETLARLEHRLRRREHPAAVRAMMAALADRLDAANRHVGIDFVNLSRVKIDPRVLRLLPQPLVNEHKVVPISFANNRLTLAMTNPSNVVAFDDVRRVIKGVLIEQVTPRLRAMIGDI